MAKKKDFSAEVADLIKKAQELQKDVEALTAEVKKSGEFVAGFRALSKLKLILRGVPAGKTESRFTNIPTPTPNELDAPVKPAKPGKGKKDAPNELDAETQEETETQEEAE